MESYGSRALARAVKDKHLKQIQLERVLWGDASGSCRSRAIEEAIEVEHLKQILLEREPRRDAAGS